MSRAIQVSVYRFNRDVSIACFSCYFTCLAVSLRVYIFAWTVSGTSVAFLGITRNSNSSAFICFSLLEGESGIGNQAVIAAWNCAQNSCEQVTAYMHRSGSITIREHYYVTVPDLDHHSRHVLQWSLYFIYFILFYFTIQWQKPMQRRGR